MNLEQRLQHAARDLREVPVAVPPLVGLARGRPRVRTMATPTLVPLLFVAGALLAIGTTGPAVDQPVKSDLPAVSGPADPSTAVAPVATRVEPEVRSTDAPSVLVEREMIAEFVGTAQSEKPPTTPVTDPVPAIRRTGSPDNVIGAI